MYVRHISIVHDVIRTHMYIKFIPDAFWDFYLAALILQVFLFFLRALLKSLELVSCFRKPVLDFVYCQDLENCQERI